MQGKNFKYRMDGNGCIGIKETINSVVTYNGETVAYTVCLTRDNEIAQRYGIKDNIFYPLIDSKIEKKGLHNLVYYKFDDVFSIVTIKFQYNKAGSLMHRTLSVYKPVTPCPNNEIYCNNVSTAYDKNQKDFIISKNLKYFGE